MVGKSKLKSPIDILIDRTDFVCSLCKTPQSVGCDCWVKLVCEKRECSRTRLVPFDNKTMPYGTVKIKSFCPWHEKLGEFHGERYFDMEENELDYEFGIDYPEA